MLNQHFIAQCFEHVAKHIRRLLDDAGVGNGVDDATFPVGLRMIQGKRQTGQSFAAAGGHGQRKEAAGQISFFPALPKHIGTQCVDQCGFSRRSRAGHMRIKSHLHLA